MTTSAAADRAATADDRRRLLRAGLVALLAAALLVVAGWQSAVWRGDTDRRAQREAVRTAAPAIIADVFSYTPHTVAADSARARTLVSDGFAAAHTAALGAQRTGAAKWTARTVGVGESGDDWAEVVAVVEVTDPATAAPAQDRIVAAGFVCRGGRWLLDSVELIR